MEKNIIPFGYKTRLLNFEDMFNEQFSLSAFEQTIALADDNSKSVLAAAQNAIRSAFSNKDVEEKYVVDMSDDLKRSIDSGDVELVTSKTGEVYAQLRSENGRFGKPLPIKKELAQEGISEAELQMALQMEAFKKQLQTIMEGMKTIECHVAEILQGQRNDRIGLFYSGLSLYTEGREIQDSDLRKQIIAQALKSINDANAQMIQEIRTDIRFLEQKKYLKEKNSLKVIDEKIDDIHQCYDIVFRSAFLKAALYYENGEMVSMLTAIDEYGCFIEKMIVPHTGLLSELDKNDKFIKTGEWGTIANKLSDCRNLKQQIMHQDTYLLNMKEDYNAER